MNFKKIYIEISNICNLQCTFCPEVERPKKVMNAANFHSVIKKVKNSADEIALHLMGEPLAHPEFRQIFEICQQEKILVNLTTNGTHLNRYSSQFFFNPYLKQINFSIHSFKDNFPGKNIWPYLDHILQFSQMALKEQPDLYINYRLWNLKNVNEQNDENLDILNYIQNFFNIPMNSRINTSHRKSKKILGKIYFHFDTRFDWPNLNSQVRRPDNQGFCYGLKSHIGIHADGTVVPCCLDKEAVLNLGSIFSNSLDEIINSARATKIREGFKENKVTEDLCKRCQYIDRFQSSIN